MTAQLLLSYTRNDNLSISIDCLGAHPKERKLNKTGKLSYPKAGIGYLSFGVYFVPVPNHKTLRYSSLLISTRFVRITLGLSVLFNFGAAAIFAFPGSSLGQLIGLPPVVSPIYAAMTAYMVGLFGAAYAWLAMQSMPPQSLLAFGAIGKLGVFCVAAGLWLLGTIPITLVVVASGDLIFALIWFGWLNSINRPTNE